MSGGLPEIMALTAVLLMGSVPQDREWPEPPRVIQWEGPWHMPGHVSPVHGMYYGGVVYLDSTLDHPLLWAAYVHEVAHYLQEWYGVRYGCVAEMERAAVEAQLGYLMVLGYTREQALEMSGLNELAVRTLACST